MYLEINRSVKHRNIGIVWELLLPGYGLPPKKNRPFGIVERHHLTNSRRKKPHDEECLAIFVEFLHLIPGRTNCRSHALWHHLAVTWENVNGSYEIFVDGKIRERGEDLAKGDLIIPEGNVVLGNDKDSHVSAGFEARDAFVGNISRVNVWDYVLPRETIELLSQRCGLENGKTVGWRDFKNGSFNGEAFIREPSSCQGVE